MTLRLAAFPLCLLGVLSTACGTYVAPDGEFATTVHPILTSRCGTCHSHDAQTTSEHGPGMFGEDDLSTSYDEVAVYVVAGDPDGSLLYQRLTADNEIDRMPPLTGQLPANDLDAIRTWIENGAVPD